MTRPLYRAPDDWAVGTLEPRRDGSAIVEAASGSTPPTDQSECWGGTTPWLTPKEIAAENGSRFVALTERSLTDVGLAHAGRLWPEMTVMLTKRAPVGLVALNQVPMATNQGFLNFRCGAGLLPEFLYYWFRANGPYLDAVANGSTYPELYVSDLFEFDIALPSIDEQRQIAGLLGALDDKIELNHRRREELEAVALALFKSWFVDFDPVHAKAEGRNSGLPQPLTELFPERFDESALGDIPAGWRIARWSDLITLEYGRALRSYSARDGQYPVFGTNGRIGFSDVALCSHAGIVIGRKGVYRGVHYSSTPFYAIDTAFYVEPKPGAQLRWAYYEMLRHDLNSMDSGSAIPSTSRDEFYAIQVVVPPDELQSAFTQVLTPAWTRQELVDAESDAVAALRDTLLPRLISGDIRVPEAERLFETAPV